MTMLSITENKVIKENCKRGFGIISTLKVIIPSMNISRGVFEPIETTVRGLYYEL